MFKIQIYENPLGRKEEMKLVNDAFAVANEEADAQKIIEEYIGQYGHHGYDGKQKSWWCRNDGDKVVQTLLIRGIEPS